MSTIQDASLSARPGSKKSRAGVTGVTPAHGVAAVLARRFQQICNAIIAESLSGEVVMQLQYAALSRVVDTPGIDQRRLADAMGVDRTNTGHLVAQLEKMGLLERRVSGTDRRARALYLTPRGKKLQHRLRPKLRAANERILATLTNTERMLLINLLVRVIETNQHHARPGAGRRKPRTKEIV
jgi:DNA-binding MarR family transcriptional regulator